jgi:hypothetical protein
VLGLAKLEGASAVFAKREDELEKEIRKKPFGVPVHFLEDHTD